MLNLRRRKIATHCERCDGRVSKIEKMFAYLSVDSVATSNAAT